MSTRSNNIEIIVGPRHDDKSDKRDSSRNGGQRGSAGGPMGGVSDRRAARNRTSRLRDREPTCGPNSERRVQVSNIPYDFRWQDLKDLFRDNVGDVTRVELFSGDCGTSKGTGIVEFRTAEIAEHAVQKMHRRNVSGRKLIVKKEGGGSGGRARDNGYDSGTCHQFGNVLLPLSFHHKHMSDAENNGAGMGPAAEGPALLSHLVPPALQHQLQPRGPEAPLVPNTFGLSVAFLDSLGIDGPLVERVFVANLDYHVDSERLREVFSLAGSVVGVQLKTDKDGRSKGHGTVQFAHPVEAVQAISMLHNQVFMDRPMTVRMDRQTESDSASTVNTKVLPAGLRSVGPGLGLDGAPLTHIVRRFSADPSPCSGPPADVAANSGTAGPPHGSLQPPPSLPVLPDGRTPAPLAMMGSQHAAPTAASVPSALQLALPPAVPAGVPPAAPGQFPPGVANHFPPVANSFPVAPASVPHLAPTVMTAMMALQGGVVPASAGAERRALHAILVRNLDPACSAQRVRDKYSEIACVTEVQLRAPGVAVVQFEQAEHAARALALTHGCRLDGHVLHVTPC